MDFFPIHGLVYGFQAEIYSQNLFLIYISTKYYYINKFYYFIIKYYL